MSENAPDVSNRPLGKARPLPNGLVLSDVDKTLYRATMAIVRGMWEGRLARSPELRRALFYWLQKRWKGRDWFAEKVDGLYMPILQQNGPARMEAFYRHVARSPELHNHGALATLRAVVNEGLHLVLISGNDRAFLTALLNENGLDSEIVQTFGTHFEVKDGQYTGDSSGMNRGAAEKTAVIEGLRVQHPEIPVCLALGDDCGDYPLFEAARADGAPSILVGNDKRFLRQLSDGGFWVTRDLGELVRSSRTGRVLQVNATRGWSGRLTLKDVADRMHDLV